MKKIKWMVDVIFFQDSVARPNQKNPVLENRTVQKASAQKKNNNLKVNFDPLNFVRMKRP